MQKASVIIAAKNEEPRISDVLSAVQDHLLVSEIIVISDGSTDKTAEIARSYGANVTENNRSRGKTLAIKEGLAKAKSDVVILLDADLKGLTSQNVTDLAKPVLDNQVDFTLSYRGNSSHIYKWFHIDFVSGERAIKKELLSDPAIWARPDLGYGLETLMNNSFLDRGKTFISVPLLNLYATPKKEKGGGKWKGFVDEFMMVFNIFRAFPFYRVGILFVEMAILADRYKRHIEKNSHDKKDK